MARKPKAEEHENLERWLVSYADFITLLFAFFVVMYSISSVNEGKYRVLSDSLIAAFHSPNKTLMPIQVGKTTKSPIEEKTKIKQSPFVIKVPEIPLPWTKDVKLKGAGSQRYRSRGAVVDKLLEKLAKEGKVQLTPRQQLA
ncbi:MAG TPA: flagellar motor protein MotB, partial [Gammaproteobacteria bacterium]|nr:flagellar motor protein MotB [Gammaproteobacteria bacterium]